MIIEAKNLKKSYKNVKALEGLSLNVPENSVFGLLGPNGAGKTTTLCLLCNVLRADGGSIKLFGKEDYYESALRIGALLQDTDLYEQRTVYDNLKFFAKLDNANEKRVSEVLKITGMEQKKDAKYGTLSNGQKKLVMFAQAMLKDPELLILDEPTAGFDPKNTILMMDIIKSLKGKTVLITSNHLDIVKKICTHVAIIYKGKIGYSGKISSKTNLEKLYMKAVK